jgi:SAM-dependent methyltransferase
MSEVVERYEGLAAQFGERVEAVPDDKWSAAAPCEGWTARDVVKHVIEGQQSIVAGLDRSRRMAGLAGRRLAGGSVVGDLRSLPFATGAVAAVTAFYCLIHLPRSDLGLAVAEIARVLRLGGRALLTAHEGEGDVRVDEFLGAAVSVPATFFRLDELVEACEKAGLDVPVAERRPPYANEGDTVRLMVLAVRR